MKLMGRRPRVSIICFCFSISDKNLTVSISGDVDEAKALSKPPEDSQGRNTQIKTPAITYTACAHGTQTLSFVVQLIFL